jgi:serralysin
MEGGSGKDVFVYSSGRDEISDFNVRDDIISLDKSLGVGSFSELLSKAKVVDDGDDVLFTFANGNTRTLQDVDVKSLKVDSSASSPTLKPCRRPRTTR